MTEEHAFPYPQNLPVGERRPDGEGCANCVKLPQCPAWYWRTRYGVKDPNNSDGTLCNSWSNNPADKVGDWTQDDLDQNEYNNEQGILIEPHSGWED